jgi:UDP-N-acetylmuramate dehydrogenase
MKAKSTDFDKAAEEFRKQISGRVEQRVLMKRYTSFRIGGLAELMVFPRNVEELALVVGYCEKQGLPWRVIGKGTNLLILDRELEEVVVNLQEGLKKIERTGEQSIRAEAGVHLNRLVKFCQDSGMAGLEWAAGIPGTVGGAIRMNAGAEKKEMAGVLSAVEIYRWPEGRYVSLKNELNYGYRRFELAPGAIIIAGQFELTRDEPAEIRKRVRACLNKRRATQPVSFPSAGSVFKNPEGDFAGRLIEEVGLKGLRNGDAQVSELHANFIINRGRAKASQVLELIDLIRRKVRKEKGINLELEIEIVGDGK